MKTWQMLTLGLLVACVSIACGTVTVQVAGKPVALSPAAELYEGTLVGPWAPCAQAMGAQVQWDAGQGVLRITAATGKTLVAGMDGRFTGGAKVQTLKPAPRIVEGQFVAPLKQLVEALDCRIEWDGKTRSARIYGTVTTLETRGGENGVFLEIRTSLPSHAELHHVEHPARSYVDLAGFYTPSREGINYINTAGVRRARWDQFKPSPPVTRVVFDLDEGAARPVWQPAPDGFGGRLVVGRVTGDETVIFRPKPLLLRVEANSPNANETIVTAYFSDPVTPSYDVLRNPYRVLVDLDGAQVPAGLTEISQKVNFMDRIRVMDQGRLVFYANNLVPFTVETLSDPDRVQVAFKRGTIAGKLIVIDPGHGGKDSGARGRRLMEKDIVLDISRRVVPLLLQMNARPVLTRDSDIFVELYDRPRMTNRIQADLFVSVHCNAFTRRDVGQGLQTYYCHPQSKALATVMQDSLVEYVKRKDGGVRHARFAVIRETQIPAVLVEILFIDNKIEEELLAKPEVRQASAVAIAEGLRRYVEGTASVPAAPLRPPGEESSAQIHIDL